MLLSSISGSTDQPEPEVDLTETTGTPISEPEADSTTATPDEEGSAEPEGKRFESTSKLIIWMLNH